MFEALPPPIERSRAEPEFVSAISDEPARPPNDTLESEPNESPPKLAVSNMLFCRALALASAIEPAEIVVVPLKVFAPPSVSVPAPTFVRFSVPAALAMVPSNWVELSPPTVSVTEVLELVVIVPPAEPERSVIVEA